MLAHELALQLSATSADPPLALALLEAPHSLRSSAALAACLPDEAQRQEVCQVAAALYPAVVAAAGAGAPSFDSFAARLASCAGHDQQLDYVAAFKPAEVRDGTAAPAWQRHASVHVPCGAALTCPPLLSPPLPPPAGSAAGVGRPRHRPAGPPGLLAGADRQLRCH